MMNELFEDERLWDGVHRDKALTAMADILLRLRPDLDNLHYKDTCHKETEDAEMEDIVTSVEV